MMRTETTIRHVARDAGVSVTTVSRVLNGHGRVSAETRERVLAVAEQLRFVPSRAAVTLVTRRSMTIGLVVPDLANSIFSIMIHEIEKTLADLGYSLIIAISNWSLREEAAGAQKLVALGAEGLIVSGCAHDESFLAFARSRRIPVVYTSYWDAAAEHATIGYDNHAAGQMAIGFLQDLGHQRVGILHGMYEESDRTRARLHGIRDGARAGTELSFHEGSLSAEAGSAGARALLQSDRPPTALLGLSDIIALGAIFYASSQGLSLPDDLSIMGFDNLNWSKDCHPPLTTIALPTPEMARRAATALVRKLEDNLEIAPQLLPAEIVERGSTGPRKL